MTLWLAWFLLGIIAGVLAQLLYPARLVRGLLQTVAFAILGAVLGGWLCKGLLTGFSEPLTEQVGDYSILAAVVSANAAVVFAGLLSHRKI